MQSDRAEEFLEMWTKTVIAAAVSIIYVAKKLAGKLWKKGRLGGGGRSVALFCTVLWEQFSDHKSTEFQLLKLLAGFYIVLFINDFRNLYLTLLHREL